LRSSFSRPQVESIAHEAARGALVVERVTEHDVGAGLFLLEVCERRLVRESVVDRL